MAQICGQQVPQELIDVIIGHLPDDKESFRSCSLVSHPFTEPSQRRLFHQFELTIKNDERRRMMFSHTNIENLLQAPLIRTSYARVLHIHIGRRESNLTSYLEFLDRFTGLEQVVLRYEGEGKENDDVIRHCCKPTLKQFSIARPLCTLWPGHHLRQCQDLYHLSIHCALPSQSDLVGIDPDYPRIPLRSLYLSTLNTERETFVDIMHDPRLPFRIDTLTALGIISTSSHHLEAIETILPMLQNLEKLGIGQSWNSFDDQLLKLDLSRLPRLKVLLLSSYEDSGISLMGWVTGQISTLPLTPIRTLHLVTPIRASRRLSFDLEWMAGRWEEVDDVLSESKFDGLQNVVVHVDIAGHDQATKEIVQLIARAMPKLNESKRLIVKKFHSEYRDFVPKYIPEHRVASYFSETFFLECE